MPDPDAAETDFQAADQVEPFVEDGTLVELAVAVGVLKDQDAVAGLFLRQLERVRVGLGDPKPAAVIGIGAFLSSGTMAVYRAAGTRRGPGT